MAWVKKGGKWTSTRSRPTRKKGSSADNTYVGGGGSSKGGLVGTITSPVPKIKGGAGVGSALPGSSGYYRSRGGSVSGRTSQIMAQQQARAREEAARKAAEKEKARIEAEKKRLLAANAKRNVIIVRDKRTGEIKRRKEEIKGLNQRIRTIYDAKTGKTRVTTFKGGRVSGGLTTSGLGRSETIKVGKKLRSSGLTPIKNNLGEIIGFRSPDTQKTYRYTNEGIAQYNKDAKGFGATLRAKDRIERETGKSVVPKERVSAKLIKVATDYTIKADAKKNQIIESARKNEIKRLQELQRARNLTAAEKAEKARLTKSVAQNYRRVADIVALSIASSIINLGALGAMGYENAPTLYRNLKNNPKETLAAIPPATLGIITGAVAGVRQDVRRVGSDPIEALRVASEYWALGKVLKIGGKGVKLGSRGTNTLLGKISRRYIKLKNGKFIIPKSSTILKSQTVKSGAKSLSAQTKLAGKKVTAVNASAQRLTSLIKRKKLVRKPIVGESSFPTKIKTLLKKFDDGKGLSFKEIQEVNKYLRKNVAPNASLLERSLYADPAKGLRVSRLGIQKNAPDATLRDILRGNFRLWQKSQKPQVLIFENAKVARFPKSLKVIERKLKAGKKLTTTETDRLIAWQIKSGSGKFKPIGSTIYAGGRELEVTLAPGELIKRIRQVGFRYINGKKVTFVTAEVFKPTKALASQIKKANLGKLTKTQVKKLEQTLSKKLGRKIRVETPNLKRLAVREARRISSNTPVLRIRGGGVFVRSFRSVRPVSRKKTRRVTSRKRTTRKVARKTPSRKRVVKRKPGRPKRKTPPRKTPPRKTPPRKTPPRKTPPRKTPPRKTKPPIRPIRGFKQKKLSKPVQTYYVVEKVRGKYRKLYPKPLKMSDARDYAVYQIDNRLSKTAFFIPIGKRKQVVRPPKKISGYYSKNSRKVRPYRIRYGKKRQLVNGYIEKRKYFQDTKNEKAQAARLRRKTPSRKRVVKKKMSAAQRKKMLDNLAKARRVRARNLRKRR